MAKKKEKLIDLKYCVGCHDNFYNPGCWSRKTGKMVKRIVIGVDQRPPYHQKPKLMPSCWHGGGGNRVCAINPDSLTEEGYWKF